MSFMELLTDVASGTNAMIRAAALKFNLTTSQAFHLLSIPYDGIPMSGLAQKLGLDTSTLTRNIQKLEILGLLRRQKDNYDKRIHKIVLTRKGSSLVKSLEILLEEQNYDVLNNIDLDTQEHLITVLEKLVWSIDCSREKL